MKCPECGYEDAWSIVSVFSRDYCCLACGFDMDGVEFYGEASAEYVAVEPLIEEEK